MSTSYNVALTRGAHTVRAEDAEAILKAIEEGRKTVQVGIEPFPGSEHVQPTILITAHIVALAPIDGRYRDVVEAAGASVRVLRRRT